MGKKRVNPRRIPLPKNAVDKDAIIEEAMKDDMTHGWLLVASAAALYAARGLLFLVPALFAGTDAAARPADTGADRRMPMGLLYGDSRVCGQAVGGENE